MWRKLEFAKNGTMFETSSHILECVLFTQYMQLVDTADQYLPKVLQYELSSQE